MNSRPLIKHIALLSFSVLTWCSLSVAQTGLYPTKPIKVIVPTASGGPSDTCIRAVSQAMQAILGQSLVIENVTGATGNIGITRVMTSNADGYTLLVPSAANTSSFVTRPQTSPDLEANFKPIGKICNATQTLVVAPNLGIKTAEEFIRYAKSNPGKLSYGSIGFGSSQQLVAEMFASAAGIEMQHIPFRGESAAAVEISAGRVQLMFMAGAKPFMDSHLVIGLATTNKDTWPAMANLPSLNKTVLPGFTYNGWNGLMAPAGTPDSVIHALSKALSESLKDEKVRSIIANMGNMPGAGTPEELGEQIHSDVSMFKKIIKERHLEFPD
jgi:tripartite-type tricarboxylate transporter receptor subunit TctC